MNRNEAIEMLKGGQDGIGRWNEWVEDTRQQRKSKPLPDLSEADFRGADLKGVNLVWTNLEGADLEEADLSGGADVMGANLEQATLKGANLEGAMLFGTRFVNANLVGADFSKTTSIAAYFTWADLRGADLTGGSFQSANLVRANLAAADLSSAELSSANLAWANLAGANLSGADLTDANLAEANLSGAVLEDVNIVGSILRETDFEGALLSRTVLGAVDLSQAKNLKSVIHHGASTIGTDTLGLSGGKIPEAFMQGCGFKPWQVLEAKLYDPSLTPSQICDLQQQILIQRAHKPLFIWNVVICYSSDDAKFVDGLEKTLRGEGAAVWHNKHEVVEGDEFAWKLPNPRVNDVIIVVLSRSTLQDSKVKLDLRTICQCEETQQRTILFRVALDSSWEGNAEIDWTQLKAGSVIDFWDWGTDAFDQQFRRLWDELKMSCVPRQENP